MTYVIPSQSHDISSFLMPVIKCIVAQWRHISSESAVALLLHMCSISIKYDAKSKAWDILFVLTSVAGNLCNKCPSSYSNKTAVKVILSIRSLVSIKQQSPRRPCDILVANVGLEVTKTAKTAKTAKCVKKNVQSSKCSKQHFQGLANKVPVKECARVFSVCQSVVPASPGPFQAQRPCPALSSLPQLCPADSSQARAQEPWPAAQRPKESAYHSGSFPEKLQDPGALTVPRDMPRKSTWPYSPPTHRNCAQAEKLHIYSVWKHLEKL